MCIDIPQQLVMASKILAGSYASLWILVISGIGLDRLRRRFAATP